MNDYDILEIIKAVIERKEADGCRLCAYEDTPEWELPCSKCSRNCKDYWRHRTEPNIQPEG